MTSGIERWAYVSVLVLVGFAMGVSASPAPLYGMWAEEWRFAPLTTTVIFAVYALAALLSVLFTGPLTDRYGRKPALIISSGALVVGLLIFAFAVNVPMLLMARAIHGIGVGGIVVAAAATLLDLQPLAGADSGLRSGVSYNLGISASVGLVSLVAAYLPHPLITPFVILTVVALLMFVAMIMIHETHPAARRSIGFRVAVPRVPAEIFADFQFAAAGTFAAWSVLGVFLSLYPIIALAAVGSHNVVFGGMVVAVSAFSAAISQMIAINWVPRTGAIMGNFGTAVAMMLCVLALRGGSPVAILIAAGVQGFFFGLAFGSSLRHLGDVVPNQKRGEVMSAFYVVAYFALAVPTVLAGWAASVWSPGHVIGPFFGCVALMSLLAGYLGWRLKPSELGDS